MRMYWKLRRRRIRHAVRDCDSVQHPAQLQVAKENIVRKHEHTFSLPLEPGQNMQRDARGPSALQIGTDKRAWGRVFSRHRLVLEVWRYADLQVPLPGDRISSLRKDEHANSQQTLRRKV